MLRDHLYTIAWKYICISFANYPYVKYFFVHSKCFISF